MLGVFVVDAGFVCCIRIPLQCRYTIEQKPGNALSQKQGDFWVAIDPFLVGSDETQILVFTEHI